VDKAKTLIADAKDLGKTAIGSVSSQSDLNAGLVAERVMF